jgi:hypothetical protein
MFVKMAKLASRRILILLVSLCPLVMHAQGNAAQDQKDKKVETPAPKPLQNVTGCIRKGDETSVVFITGEDGKTWELRSSSVKLDRHIGHKVTVTGSTTLESKAEEKREEKVEKAAGKEDCGDLRVTSLKLISQTCK